MNNASSWQAYWLIRRGRARKKMKVYKKMMALSFDLTTSLYSLIVGGYVFASIFIFNDFLAAYQDQFLFIEEQLTERFWLIFSILPLRYVFQSFRNPGILITSSEYQLAMLPYEMKRIVLFTALEKWVKLLLKYAIVSAAIILITPIKPEIIVVYLAVFWLIELLMTIPQWKLFQVRFIPRFILFVVLILVNFLGTVTQVNMIISFIVFTIVVLSNFLLFKRMFTNINWGRVTEVNDFLVWNMPAVSKATKVKFKRQRKHNLFLNRASRKKPFVYTDSAIYRRLWLQHFRGNIEYIVQVIGGLVLAITVLSFFNEFLGMILIALSIHIYTAFCASLFVDRFHSGIVQVLPWNIESYRRTMRRWAIIGFIPVLIPITIIAVILYSWWSITFLLLVISLYMIHYMSKMDNAFESLNKRLVQFSIKGVIAFGSLGIIIACHTNPHYSAVSIVILLYGFIQLKFRKSKTS
ncbi:hypothetical protein H8S33_09090 [Ornithinibacillus sp. BX22]|uniref:Uncharacterized protein n=2 Tax=Ornithinibacillus TaxID=484508 RepID=A0A923L5Q5_9BACI|nr:MULTISPECIES: hypothetical protein [Ornithinibacillus]MBC5636972.1 hypothetical protein [Ornithinibacillus hominis]MBS3681538.1 hypothetical protein [Ornithinibacillus massiliensis]